MPERGVGSGGAGRDGRVDAPWCRAAEAPGHLPERNASASAGGSPAASADAFPWTSEKKARDVGPVVACADSSRLRKVVRKRDKGSASLGAVGLRSARARDHLLVDGRKAVRARAVRAAHGRVGRLPAPVAPLEVQGHVHEADEHRHLHQRADDGGEGLARVQAEDGDGDRDGKLEVVRGGREGEGGRLRVVGMQPRSSFFDD